MAEIEKLDLHSMNVSEEKKTQLKVIFPEIFTEGNKIDFERLKSTLGEMVDTGKERYGMNWPGKADCFRTIQQPSVGTLLPSKEESIDFDNTQNLFIEGDNLEVLKLLQKAYFKKVKMIYIDPPYNTGNDFIYPDNYSESLKTYLRYTGQVDDEGKRFLTNTDTDGRYHSKWMNMMYPRLFLARNLLLEEGIIFISIDDHEVDNLKKICNEVFGEENFIVNICHKSRASVSNDKIMSENHNHILLYAKNYQNIFNGRKNFGLAPDLEGFDKSDDKGYYKLVPVDGPGGASKGNPFYSFLGVTGYFRFSQERMSRMYDEGLIVKAGETLLQKYYLEDAKTTRKTDTTWWDHKFYNSTATNRLKALMGGDYFDNPKPIELIERMIELWARNENDIILDFFGGSGSTAQAVIEFNAFQNAKTNFIIVQLPERIEEGTEAFKAGYQTIADICKERIRRVINKVKHEKDTHPDMFKNRELDLGFRVFKLNKSNFNNWNNDIDKSENAINEQLELNINHIDTSRRQEDILYEILLKSGFELTTPMETLCLAGKTVYSIAEGAMLICLENEITVELIRAMAEKSPSRVVCLDMGFKDNDQLKTNAVQIMKVKDIKFRTI